MNKMIYRLLAFSLIILLMLVACRDEEDTPQPTAVSTQAAAPEVEAPTEEVEVPAAEPTEAAEEAPTAAPETAVGGEGTAAEGEEPIYLSIIWHQHQPVYFKDPQTNVYVRPWVRMHATKDYVDMAAILRDYPDVHATYNLTPSLIRQLDDLAAGAKDLYWVHTEVAAEELTDEQKQFILDRFFDTNRKIIDRFPRYVELLAKRDSSSDALNEYTVEDYRDLQLLFNLAWTDPDWLEQEPLAAIVAQERDYTEEDKATILGEHLRLIEEVIPVHRELQDAGQIEVTMTPFAHPILPLLVSTNLAQEALPDAELPAPFQFGQDAVAQVELGVQLYAEHFGRPPRGMWPAEGSVAQEIVGMVAQNGIQWMASDEGVLASSLGLESFTRNSNEVVVEADQLYRPYYVEGVRGGPVAIVFRDVVISDKVGFTYSGLPGGAAAVDFINRIHAIRQQLQESGAEGPHLVSVILDGENAWEHYDNDGKAFLHTLYEMLSEDPLIETVTPSEFLEIAPDQPPIADLWAGSWINHDFGTWIGEEEENRGWELLLDTRNYLQTYLTGNRQGEVSEEALAEATTQMYIAEGSDWFWWYGSDQNSGNDESFDEQYRNTLKQVYLALGAEPPQALDVPIIPQQAAAADRPSSGLLTPTIDGTAAAGEWDAAGGYAASGGVMAAASPFFSDLAYGFDSRTLYLKIETMPDFAFPAASSTVDVYLNTPVTGETAAFSRGGTLLGFPANRLLEIIFEGSELGGATLYEPLDGEWTPLAIARPSEPEQPLAVGGEVIEAAIPLHTLGNADSGAELSWRAFYQESIGDNRADADQIPGTGPAVVAVPDLGTTTFVLDVADPEGDDHGPGSYTYPTDGVFSSGNFDITSFQVGIEEQNIVFRFTVAGPVDNVWDSPNGIALQTFDIYIDTDGDGQGGSALLPGRNLALAEGEAWDYAITIEGWEAGIYTPGAEGPLEIAGPEEFSVLADPGQRRVTIRVPKSIIGETPEAWRYAAVVMGQEGFPSSGVMRVRDVAPAAEQWRIGGAPGGSTNHTRVVDLVWPEEGQQEAWLSEFEATDAAQGDLTAENFARILLMQP